MGHIQLLTQKGITFSRGICATEKTLQRYDLTTEGLLNIHQNAKHGSLFPPRYTVNDIPIPTPVLGGQWYYGPRQRVTEIQNNSRLIYMSDGIRHLEDQIKLLGNGRRNIQKILKDVVSGRIELPKNYSQEGVEFAYQNGSFSVDQWDLERRLKLLQEAKKFYDSLTISKKLDTILSIDPQSIAEDWRVRTLPIKPTVV